MKLLGTTTIIAPIALIILTIWLALAYASPARAQYFYAPWWGLQRFGIPSGPAAQLRASTVQDGAEGRRQPTWPSHGCRRDKLMEPLAPTSGISGAPGCLKVAVFLNMASTNKCLAERTDARSRPLLLRGAQTKGGYTPRR